MRICLQGDEDEDKDKLLMVLGEVSRDYLVKSRYSELHSSLYGQTIDEIHLKVDISIQLNFVYLDWLTS